MKKSDWSFLHIFFLVISIFIIVVAVFIPDNDSTKNLIIGSLIIIALVILDINAPKIAKLSSDNPKIKTLRTINRMVIAIAILILIFIKLNPIGDSFSPRTREILSVGAISLFMIIFGNLAPKIPFNRYVGLRLPWTIRDEDTWKLAHKIVGFIAFPLALIQFILVFFFKAETIAPICILLWIAIPGLYSGWFYYKKFRKA